MLRSVKDYINKYKMIEKGDRIVVGVSGGADSVCLFYVLKELCKEVDAEIIVAHINHGLRGAEADRDQMYVANLCREWDIDFHCRTYNVKELARTEGISEEEAGRNVRYKTFMEICKNNMCNKIAVAHNKNDNAETVLFHLVRGTGLKGLTGIEPCRKSTSDFGEITIIRPILCLERYEIENYLQIQGISYQTDSTNLTEDYSRNKIRNRVLTYISKEINSGVISNINGAAAQLREIEDYLKDNIESRFQVLVKVENERYFIPAELFEMEPLVIQKGILKKILEYLAGSSRDIEAKHVEDVRGLLGKQVGRYIHLPYSIIAEREYNGIKLYNYQEDAQHAITKPTIVPVLAPIPGEIYLPAVRKKLVTMLITYKKSEPIPKSGCIKWFDYDKIENAVEIRSRKKGDYFQINSSGGRKKLKDYFIDQKVPQKMRDNQILIADGNHIMWIVGELDRISEKYKVDETTDKILLIKLIDTEENDDER
jgi:tRNA(Ile)-lysidine synthase